MPRAAPTFTPTAPPTPSAAPAAITNAPPTRSVAPAAITNAPPTHSAAPAAITNARHTPGPARGRRSRTTHVRRVTQLRWAWVLLVAALSSAATGSAAEQPETPPAQAAPAPAPQAQNLPRHYTNQSYAEDVMRETTLAIDDPMAVLTFVLGSLPDRV